MSRKVNLINIWISFIKKLIDRGINFDDFSESTNWNGILEQFKYDLIETGLILKKIKDPYNFEFTKEVLKSFNFYNVLSWNKKYNLTDYDDLERGVKYFTDERIMLNDDKDTYIVNILFFLMAVSKDRDEYSAGNITLYHILKYGSLEQ
jgi:hypothetical protein